jgi:quercetin dioxygenase-like cupin family protein
VGNVAIEKVFSVDALPWRGLGDLPGARGFEFKPLVGDDPNYTTAFSFELVRLDPSDHSLPHIEPWNHALYFIKGNGEIRIGSETWPVREGKLARPCEGGEQHTLGNAGSGEMLILAIYNPPRRRS